MAFRVGALALVLIGYVLGAVLTAVASDLCAWPPTAIAVENPNLQVSYRQGFTIQGVYTQEELEATVRAWT